MVASTFLETWERASVLAIPPGYIPGVDGFYRPERTPFLLINRLDMPTIQQRLLAWMRDHVHIEIPRAYYRLVLGHDLHVSSWAELYVRHFHAPQDPDEIGWWENVGRVSRGKITTAFRDFECTNLVNDSVLYGDFKYHEVGLSNAAEANTQTSLTTSTGIARVIGNQTNPSASSYQSIATVTADTAETWQEHGIFNALTGPTLLDRSLISPVVAVQINDTVEFTYILTKVAEA